MQFVKSDYHLISSEIINNKIFMKNPRRLFIFHYLHTKINPATGHYLTTPFDIQKACGGRIQNIKNDLKLFEENGFFKIEKLSGGLLVTLIGWQKKVVSYEI